VTNQALFTTSSVNFNQITVTTSSQSVLRIDNAFNISTSSGGGGTVNVNFVGTVGQGYIHFSGTYVNCNSSTVSGSCKPNPNISLIFSSSINISSAY
jgi:hypothetical protein